MYYFSEISNPGSFRRAEKLVAKNLVSAKIEASKKSRFFGTTLVIGTEVDDKGFVFNPIAEKTGGKWTEKWIY